MTLNMIFKFCKTKFDQIDHKRYMMYYIEQFKKYQINYFVLIYSNMLTNYPITFLH